MVLADSRNQRYSTTIESFLGQTGLVLPSQYDFLPLRHIPSTEARSRMLRAGSAAKELVPGHASGPRACRQKYGFSILGLISETIRSLFEPIGISHRPLWHHWVAPLPNVDAENTCATVLRLGGPDDLGSKAWLKGAPSCKGGAFVTAQSHAASICTLAASGVLIECKVSILAC